MNFFHSSKITFFLFFLPLHAASADLVTSLTETTTTSGSVFLYTYTLTNLSNSTLLAQDFSIDMPATANLFSITGPFGWTIAYQPGDEQVTWYSDFPGTLVSPGSTVTFSFDSSLAPGQSSYQVDGIDVDGQNYGTNTGQIASPGISAVPEPTSMIPLGIGMATLAGYTVYRGKREQ